MYLETDSPINLGSNGSGNCGNGMWGNESWWIIIILFFALFNNNWGGNGRGATGSTGSEILGYELGKTATQADIASGFNNSALLGSLNDIKLAQQNGFANVQQTLCQGFGGVNTALVQQGYETRLGLNGISTQIANCCCDLRAGQADIKYAMSKDTCDIIQSQNAGVQRIIDYMSSEKIASLQAENQTLRFQASQAAQNAFITANQSAQTAELIRRLGRDCPTPAFIVPNPNCCYPTPTYSNNSCFGCNN